jgi:hypothetical protein
VGGREPQAKPDSIVKLSKLVSNCYEGFLHKNNHEIQWGGRESSKTKYTSNKSLRRIWPLMQYLSAGISLIFDRET